MWLLRFVLKCLLAYWAISTIIEVVRTFVGYLELARELEAKK